MYSHRGGRAIFVRRAELSRFLANSRLLTLATPGYAILHCILLTISIHFPVVICGTVLETHLLESGVDVRYRQERLGRSSSRTTEIYTHVSRKEIGQIVNLFDRLFPRD